MRRRWYLIAFDLVREDWRIFRLDRVEGTRPTSVRFVPRTARPADPVAFVTSRLCELAPTHRALITLHAATDEVAPELPTGATLTALSARRSSLVIETETIEWLAILLLRLRCTFTVHEPIQLITRLREIESRLARSLSG